MISKLQNKIVMMSLLLAIVTLNLGSQAKGITIAVPIYGFVDDTDPAAIETSFATHIGVAIRNTSTTEVLTITNVSLANLTIIGGTYGNFDSEFDIMTRTNTGSIDAFGNLASSFDINSGEIAFFSLQVNSSIGSFDYDRASYTGGAFEPDEMGSATSFMEVTNSFNDGGFAGTAGTGLDDVGSFAFEGATSSVPEPSSTLLMGLGSVCLLLRRKR